MSNRWIDRFDGLLDREVLRERAQIKAVPLSDINAKTPQASFERLNDALKGFCYLSNEDLDVLFEIVSSGINYCREAYADEAKFLEMLHLEELPPCSIEPKCLASMAGTGKSDLFKAAERLMPIGGQFTLPTALPNRFDCPRRWNFDPPCRLNFDPGSSADRRPVGGG